VWTLLSDPQATAVSVVTVAEELPVNETVAICNQVRGELRLPEGILVVNRFHAPDFSQAELTHASASWRRGVSEPCDALAKAVLVAAEEEVSWGALNEHHRRKLAAETGWPLVVLPFLFREEFGFADVEALSGRLDEVLALLEPGRRAEGRT
jgi:hypothetical protein